MSSFFVSSFTENFFSNEKRAVIIIGNQGECCMMLRGNIEIYQEIDKWQAKYKLTPEEIDALYLKDGVTTKSLERQLQELENNLKALTPSREERLLQAMFGVEPHKDEEEEKQKLREEIQHLKQKLSDPENLLVYATSRKKPRLRTYPTSNTEEKVFQANLYLARKLAMIYYYKSDKNYEYDDLFQEASEALLQAVHYYVPLGEATFKTYATKCIENRLKRVVFPKKKKRKRLTRKEYYQQELDNLERLYLYIEARYIQKDNLFLVNHYPDAWRKAIRKWNSGIKMFNREVQNLGEENRVQPKVKIRKENSYEKFLEELICLVKATNLEELIDEEDRKMVNSLQNFKKINSKDKTVFTMLEYIRIARKKLEDIQLYLEVEASLRNQGQTPTLELMEKAMNEHVKELNSMIRFYQNAPSSAKIEANILDRTWYSIEYYDLYKVDIFNPEDRAKEFEDIRTLIVATHKEPLDEESMIREVQQELMERKQKVSQVVASENKKIYAENKKRLQSHQALQRKGKYYRKYTLKDIQEIENNIMIQENSHEEWITEVEQKESTTTLSVEDEAIQNVFLEDYYKSLEELPEQEKEVLKRWYNFLGKHEMNAKEIAEELNISPRIVYQKKEQALKRLAKVKRLIAYQENE